MHHVETMAYAGQVPWHGVGSQLAPGQSIEVWRERAGMNWSLEEAEVRFAAEAEDQYPVRAFPGQKVLYRSDTKRPLAVVSKRYQVVQPREILEFYRDLTRYSGFELETAGVLRGGRKFWALARTGQGVALKGQDQVNGYLLLATACDGTLATTAQFTSVRVVCNNTLQVAVGDRTGAIKVPHRSAFDADRVKSQLGIAVEGWHGFVERMRILCETPVNPDSVDGVLRNLLTYPVAQNGKAVVNEQAVAKVRALYDGQGRGASLKTSKGTVFGLLNSITEFVDHQGMIIAGDSAQSQVTARFPGTVRALMANVGDNVKAGQVLATVDSNLSLSAYSINAPRSGVVVTRAAQVGGGAAEGQVLFEIADLSQVWVDVHVFGAEAASLRPGDEIEVVDLYGGEPSVGRLQRILPGTAIASQSVVGRAVLENPASNWRPGAGVNVRITTASENADLVVPQSAVQSMDGRDAVFVRTGDTYTSHPVTLGKRDATHVQVLEGVAASDEVVVEQSYLIKADIEKSAAGHDH